MKNHEEYKKKQKEKERIKHEESLKLISSRHLNWSDGNVCPLTEYERFIYGTK